MVSQRKNCRFPCVEPFYCRSGEAMELGMGSRITAFAVVAVLAAIALPESGKSEMFIVEGRAQIIDGVTLEIWGKRVRLAGIAGVEPDSQEGHKAKIYLEKLVAGVAVRCETSGEVYRTGAPGRCSVGTVDIGLSLVKAGHARQIVQQSSGR